MPNIDQTRTQPASGGDGVLRFGLFALTYALLGLSILFALYLYKQNNLLMYQVDTQKQILATQEPIFEGNKGRIELLVEDLKAFAQTYPDILPILYDFNLVKIQTRPGLTPSGALSSPPSDETQN